MEGQVPLSRNSDRVDGGLVSVGEVGVHFHDTAVQHPDVRGGDSVCVVERGRSPSQVLTWTLRLCSDSLYPCEDSGCARVYRIEKRGLGAL